MIIIFYNGFCKAESPPGAAAVSGHCQLWSCTFSFSCSLLLRPNWQVRYRRKLKQKISSVSMQRHCKSIFVSAWSMPSCCSRRSWWVGSSGRLSGTKGTTTGTITWTTTGTSTGTITGSLLSGTITGTITGTTTGTITGTTGTLNRDDNKDENRDVYICCKLVQCNAKCGGGVTQVQNCWRKSFPFLSGQKILLNTPKNLTCGSM